MSSRESVPGRRGGPRRGMGPVRPETLRTARLELLTLRVAHAREMAQVLADPALHGFTGGEPDSAEALYRRYERLVAGAPDPAVRWCNRVVRHRASGRLIGYVQATIAPAEDGRPVAELAWVIGTPWQGRGFAREAAAAVVDRLRRHPVAAVVAHIHPEHHASAAVAAAVGLSPTGRLHDGEMCWELTLGGRDAPQPRVPPPGGATAGPGR